MELLDTVKSILTMVQKIDNVALQENVIALSKQSAELNDEVVRLREENKKLKEIKSLEAIIVRHEEPVITRKDDALCIYYCAHCWDNERKTIQVECREDGTFFCAHCQTVGTYNRAVKKIADEAEMRNMQLVY